MFERAEGVRGGGLCGIMRVKISVGLNESIMLLVDIYNHIISTHIIALYGKQLVAKLSNYCSTLLNRR